MTRMGMVAPDKGLETFFPSANEQCTDGSKQLKQTDSYFLRLLWFCLEIGALEHMAA